MTSLPSIERLSPEQLVALKAKIETRQAKQAQTAANLQTVLAQASQTLQALTSAVEAAGMALPPVAQASPVQAQAAPNGKHQASKIARAKRRAARRAKARQQTTPVVEAAKPVTTPHPTKGVKIGIKYRDPHNPALSWSGRGKVPGWMAKSGLPKEHFLVK